jgi:GNAT superfamily N-acetyltransferase
VAMALTFDWLGREAIDRIAQIRWQCYGGRTDEREGFHRRSLNGAWGDGDVLVATDGGRDVGTATTLWQHLHVRGKRLPSQGVAWVGTAKSHRRRTGGGRGIASQVMDQMLTAARDRGCVASALMPFRASFYEHFGYGVVERQATWRVPLSLLPTEPGDWRFGDIADAPAMVNCRARQSLTGQCDVETSDKKLDEWFAEVTSSSQLFVNEVGGQINAYAWIKSAIEGDGMIAQLVQPAWDGVESLRLLLGFCGGLRDQYSAVSLVLPADFPLNWLLKERQTPHRRVDHPTPTCKIHSRMQLRILDHVRFLDGQHAYSEHRGGAVIAVRECEGGESNFKIDVEGGRVAAKKTDASPDAVCSDVTWAAVASGELRASTASALGLLECPSPATLRTLNVLAEGPLPFCCEYF